MCIAMAEWIEQLDPECHHSSLGEVEIEASMQA
jgi:hypothetical protein